MKRQCQFTVKRGKRRNALTKDPHSRKYPNRALATIEVPNVLAGAARATGLRTDG